MKSKLLVFILLLGVKQSIGQTNFNKTWLQGTNFQFKTYFNKTTTINQFIDTSTLYFSHGLSNICDSNGNLILCSDGFNLYDSSLNYIEGGDTLGQKEYYDFEYGWSVYPQSSIILPFDGRIYYLITATSSDSNLNNVWLAPNSKKAPFDLLLANKIDMNANLGKGKVIERMKPR